MFSRLPDAELAAFKVAIANEQARRQNASDSCLVILRIMLFPLE